MDALAGAFEALDRPRGDIGTGLSRRIDRLEVCMDQLEARMRHVEALGLAILGAALAGLSGISAGGWS